jgi:hypothetical protein
VDAGYLRTGPVRFISDLRHRAYYQVHTGAGAGGELWCLETSSRAYRGDGLILFLRSTLPCVRVCVCVCV